MTDANIIGPMSAAQCQQCGAAPDLDAVQKGQCRYCGVALPHAVKAAAKAQLLQQLLTDEDGDGIPDALEALQTVQAVGKEREEKEAERKRTRFLLDHARNAGVTLGGVVMRALAIAIFFGPIWALFTCGAFDSDPWLGLHADTFCPATCEGCTSPYVWHSWTSSGTGGDSDTIKVYCQHDELVSTGWLEMMANLDANARFEVAGGLMGIVLSSIATWFVAGMLLAWWWRRKDTTTQRARIPELEAKLQRLDEELGPAT